MPGRPWTGPDLFGTQAEEDAQGHLEVPPGQPADSRAEAETMAEMLNYRHPVLGHTWAAVCNTVGDWTARPVIIL